tara:strand:- start:17316 stop:18989 length:1674 start_codon:yes stop_codon:yes gene_type:complete
MSNPASNPVVQNSQTNNAKYLSIIPENGTEFKAGQKVVFNIDPSVGWIKGRDSYLVWDILNDAATPLKMCLKQGGISSVIKQVNVFSQHNGMLLESLDNYNQWTHTELQYRHDDTTNITNVEGAATHLQSQVGLIPNGAAGVLSYHNFYNNYNDPATHRLTNNDAAMKATITSVRFCCPLRAGIFRHWDTETLVPVLQMGGLRIELILADPKEVVELSMIGAGVNIGGNKVVSSIDNSAGLNLNIIGATTDATIATDTFVRITDDNIELANCGLLVGQPIQVGNATTSPYAATLDTFISALETDAGGRVKITLGAAVGAIIPSGEAILTCAPAVIKAATSYKITGCELRVLQEMPPDNKPKSVDYVFTSYDMFRDTIPKSQTSFNADITSVASKAVSLFTLYEDPQYENGTTNLSKYYSGITPSELGVNMNSVVYFINNKLYPLRAYDPSAYGDRIINQNEVVKAFGTLSFPVKCLGSTHNCDLGLYSNRYLHARELARGNSVFNLQNAEPQIRIGFSAARGDDKFANPIGNLRMNTYVFSKKILHIDAENGLSLEH